ncbi:MAG: hemolysin III family protein [Clostridia bacterium]|nr:hemolysin III family protein [Clostridia bacterium]
MSEKEERVRKKGKESKESKESRKRVEQRREAHSGKHAVNEPPKRSVLEEVGNAVTHGVGALLSVAGMVLLLLKSDTGVKAASSVIYGVCMIIMFLMSCLYHAFRHGTRVKRLWRRFDYISIYLLIGGTFTPLWLIYWGDRTGTILCLIQWGLIAAGLTMVGIFGPGRPKALHMVLFVVLGWCGLVFLPRMIRDNPSLFRLILGGGVIYTLGIIPFALKKRGSHFLWHFFVLFGAMVQWMGIYLYVY